MRVEHGIIVGGKLHVSVKMDDYLSNEEMEQICNRCSLKERCSNLKAAGDIFCDSMCDNPSIYFKEVEGWSLSLRRPKRSGGAEAAPAGDLE